MVKFRSFSLLLFLAVACLLISIALPVAHGQTLASTASFSGSVSDPSGARVANANITISSPEKGITRAFKTDAEGNFTFGLLPAATYTLTVEAPGFRTFKQEGIMLEVGQSATQSIALTIGKTEQIEVTSATPLLQTDDANIAAEVSTKQVTELPLNLRNVFNFVVLNSSVNNLSQSQVLNAGGEQGSADQDVSFLNFGGGYFGTTAFLLDGTWDTSQGWGGVMYVPSPDDVQEFKVQQNSFTSQYGWSTGNVITVLTKSGASNLHGNVYEFLRNGDLDANNFFSNLDGLPRPNEHRDQFGVAVGGPVYLPKVYEQRNKTFFFFLYEGHRENNPASSGLGTVPTTAMRTGDFSALMGAQVGTDALCRPIYAGELYDPFTTRQVTATCAVTGQNTVGQTVYIRDPIAGNNLANSTKGIDAVGQKLVNYYPAPLNNALVNNWSAVGTNSDNSNEYSGRIDQNIGDNTRLYGRFSWKSESKGEAPDYFGANNPAGPGQINPNNRWDFAVGASQVFTPTLTMSVNVGAMKWVEGNNMASYGFQPSSLGLPSFIDPYSPQFPVINASGYESEGPLQGAGEARFPRDAGTASVDFVKVRGKHSLSFGYMAVAVDENGGRITPTTFTFNTGFTAGPNPQDVTAGTGDAMASLMLGTAQSGGTGVSLSQITRIWRHGVYLQDDWKITPKLTLNLGLRWEVQVPLRERHNRQAHFDYSAVNPITAEVANGTNYLGELVFSTPSDRGLYNTDFKNFAPRIGFAYQLLPKLVMRGGYGIFYPPSLLGNGPEPGYTSATPFIASNNGFLTPDQTLSTAFAGGLVPIVGNTLGGLTNVGFSTAAIAPNRKSYYFQQWMYGFQYAPTPNDIIDITYVGNHGVHLITNGINTNQLNPTYFSMGNALLTPVANPFYGHITSSGCSGYDLSAPTVPQAALLRPYPEFCDINETYAPVGSSHYDALDLSYTHRLSRGLTLLASYTFSKFIDNVAGPNNWASTSASTTRNVYNLAADKSVDSTDTPNSFVLSYVYEIPVGKGKQFGSGMNGVLNAIVGGWQTTGIFTIKQGFPLSISSPGNGLNYFGAGQNVDVVGNYHISNPSINKWFNTSAFALAAPWTLGNAPRYFSDLRAPRYNNWDMGIQKYIPIHENIRLQFRVDFFNAFNHPQFYAPNMTYNSGEFGKITEAFTPRLTQAVLKLYW
jgi:Carboxypeptidase regulatory-like domain